MDGMSQNKLHEGKLLNANGELSECGYATHLVKQYDRKAVKASKMRIKEWDYYLVTNQDFGVALTMADNGYMGLLSATFFDFKNKTEKTVSPMVIMPMGKMHMPNSSESGDVHFENKKVELSYYHEEGGRRLVLNMPNFDGAFPLIVDILLIDIPAESMVIATPFKEDPKAFYYNQKIVGMRAQGIIIHKGKELEVRSENSFGILDWGRGVWTYENTWYWGAGNGLIDGKIFGFNIGYGFGDTSAATENMLFHDGKAHKLDGIEFVIPKRADGHDDFMRPWKFTSTDGRFEADFTPILDRSALTSLVIIASDQHQVFGYFNGKAILDDGTVIKLVNFLGFAEKVSNKW